MDDEEVIDEYAPIRWNWLRLVVYFFRLLENLSLVIGHTWESIADATVCHIQYKDEARAFRVEVSKDLESLPKE